MGLFVSFTLRIWYSYRFFLFLDFHFVKVGDFPLDCLYGFGLVDTVDMQIDDNARFQVQNVR